jgi:hypothetical protein
MRALVAAGAPALHVISISRFFIHRRRGRKEVYFLKQKTFYLCVLAVRYIFFLCILLSCQTFFQKAKLLQLIL